MLELLTRLLSDSPEFAELPVRHNEVRCAILCYAVLLCAGLWCGVVCYSVLCCAALCCAVLCCAVQCFVLAMYCSLANSPR